MTTPLDLTVVVPVRDAELLVEQCLDSVVAANPSEIIVVDGNSTDRTLELLERFDVTLLSDGGGGLPKARLMGAEAAKTDLVALIDADVVLPEGSLEALRAEFIADRYTALQAGLHSVGGPGYWGSALAHHHRTGRSKNWFGLVATIFRRDVLVATGFDEQFKSGEDIELRWRLQRSGAKAGVSKRVVVTHRFADDSFEFAKDQFLADGAGLGRMVRKHGWSGLRLALLPLAAAVRGIGLSLFKLEPEWVRYYAAYAWFNYVAMFPVLRNK